VSARGVSDSIGINVLHGKPFNLNTEKNYNMFEAVQIEYQTQLQSNPIKKQYLLGRMIHFLEVFVFPDDILNEY